MPVGSCRPSALVSDSVSASIGPSPPASGRASRAHASSRSRSPASRSPGVDVQQHERRVGAEQRDGRLEEAGQVTVELPVAGRSSPEGRRIQQQRVVLASAPALAVDEAAGVLVDPADRRHAVQGGVLPRPADRRPRGVHVRDPRPGRRQGDRRPPGVGEQVQDVGPDVGSHSRYVSRCGSGRKRQGVDHPGPVGGLLGEQAGVAGRGAADQEPVGRRGRSASGRGAAGSVRQRAAADRRGPRRWRRRATRRPRRGHAGRWRGNRGAPGPRRPSIRGAARPESGPHLGLNRRPESPPESRPVSWRPTPKSSSL